ncbi:transcriptional regulator with XRE-family HTH domain [Streptomyces filamentosus]
MVVKTVGEGLEQVLDKALTRKAPQSIGAQARFLVKKTGSTKAAAELLGVSPRTVQRYMKGEIKNPHPRVAGRLGQEVRKRWQPKVKEKARQAAVSSNGLMINVRASLGYEGPAGTTDQARERDLTVALSPRHAEKIFAAQELGEQRMREEVADALREVYFQQRGTRAASLEKVHMLNVAHIEFDL